MFTDRYPATMFYQKEEAPENRGSKVGKSLVQNIIRPVEFSIRLNFGVSTLVCTLVLIVTQICFLVVWVVSQFHYNVGCI